MKDKSAKKRIERSNWRRGKDDRKEDKRRKEEGRLRMKKGEERRGEERKGEADRCQRHAVLKSKYFFFKSETKCEDIVEERE